MISITFENKTHAHTHDPSTQTMQGYGGKAYEHSCLILTLILLGLLVPWQEKCCQGSGRRISVFASFEKQNASVCVCVCVAFRPLLASSCPNGRAACSEVNHHCEPPTPSLLSPLLLHLSQEWTDTSPLARGKTSASHGPPSMSPISLRYHGPRAAAMW